MNYSKKIISISAFSILIIACFFAYNFSKTQTVQAFSQNSTSTKTDIQDPLSIDFMRNQNYPGSDLVIEKELKSESNYSQYIASYKSENLKIYGLLTVPKEKKPKNGWPVIIFNHGYIRPSNYKTTVRYELYVKAFAKSGYIVFKPDFRGHGNSEGQPNSQYFTPDYTIDALNAVATLKKYKDANPEKIGMWGHSDGGNVILRSIVVDTKDIKAASIWGGVVGSYEDLTADWQKRVPYKQPKEDVKIENNNMQNLLDKYGTPSSNPDFWKTIEPLDYLADIKTPLQIDTGSLDEQVPPDFSAKLNDKLLALKKTVEYNNYKNGNHNISLANSSKTVQFTIPNPDAIKSTINFFDKYLK